MTRPVNLIVFLIITLLTGSALHSKESESPDYLKYVNEIVEDFVRSMKKKYKLHCYGSGGSMPTDIEKIEVLFISYRKSTVNDARKMEVSAIQELLHRINTHEKIRPYLREYPFHADRIGVSISFRTETDDRPLDGSVAYISTGKSRIFYYTAEIRTQDPIPLIYMNEKNEVVKKLIAQEPEEELVPLQEETYEEALKIVGTTHLPHQR